MLSHGRHLERTDDTAESRGRSYKLQPRVESLENGWPPIRVAVLEFPTMEQARAWYHSPEYAPLIPIRMKAAKSRLTLLEGV
ncbi:MAG: DUF1330 domain-containing protein [Acidobacteria bacterium]|nr:MAG: DUF1330 domain-containing protein [Acidobacteriota bacterium]